MDGITKMISELTEILSQGISNLFKDSKDDEKTTELKEDEENDDEEDEMKSRHLEGSFIFYFTSGTNYSKLF